MLARRLASVLPVLTQDEALEAAAVQSLAGSFRPEAWRQRPWRAPHHSASSVALVGGGVSVQIILESSHSFGNFHGFLESRASLKAPGTQPSAGPAVAILRGKGLEQSHRQNAPQYLEGLDSPYA